MKKFTKLFASAMAGVMLLTMFGCGGSAAQTEGEGATQVDNETTASVTTVNPGKLTWATNAEFEPYEYREGDAIVGIDADVTAYIAEQLGLEPQCEDMVFDSIIASVNSGKADIGIAGMTVTEDRLENVDFSDPYTDAGQVVIVRFDSPIKTADDLKNKTIAVQAGTTGDTYATDNIEGTQVDRYTKGAEAVQAVLQKKADAVIIDNNPAKAFVAKDDDLVILDEPLTVEEYAIAVKKGNTALLDEINRILAEMKENGEMDKIMIKYLGGDEDLSSDLSEEGTTEADGDAELVTDEAATEAADAEVIDTELVTEAAQ